MILYKKRTTKVLIRQSRSAGWSVHLVFTTLRRQVFWHWGPYSACTSGRFGRFYVWNWLPYAENPKIGRTLTSKKNLVRPSAIAVTYIGIENLAHLISPPTSESQVCVTAVILDKEFSNWPMDNFRPPTACCAVLVDRC